LLLTFPVLISSQFASSVFNFFFVNWSNRIDSHSIQISKKWNWEGNV